MMPSEAKSPPASVYLSYSQKDKVLKQEFEDYLLIMQDEKLISGWVEREVRQRKDWSQEIDPRSQLADLFLIFMSTSLISSGYCSGAEVLRTLERNLTSPTNKVLVPIILYPVNLIGHPLAIIQSIPRGNTVSSSFEHHAAWHHVDREIRNVLNRISWKQQQP